MACGLLPVIPAFRMLLRLEDQEFKAWVQDQPGLLRDTSTKQNFFKKKMEDGVWLNKPLILLERRKHPDIRVIHCHLVNWGD